MWLAFDNRRRLTRGVLLVLGLVVSLVGAAMSPPEITLACNGLARMSFDLKDLVNLVALKRNPGPFQVPPPEPACVTCP